jgi:uncharacterized membrane protein YeaQ/YmgE (transglycosylase-associated protein family)
MDQRGLIATLVIGIVAGWIAGMLVRGRGYGIIMDLILGLIGAVVGRWIFNEAGIVVFGGLGHLAMSTVGAVVLVAATHIIRRV